MFEDGEEEKTIEVALSQNTTFNSSDFLEFKVVLIEPQGKCSLGNNQKCYVKLLPPGNSQLLPSFANLLAKIFHKINCLYRLRPKMGKFAPLILAYYFPHVKFTKEFKAPSHIKMLLVLMLCY